MTSLSIVVPIYNEEENVKKLHKEIIDVCKKNKYSYEVIFVDDGSSDNTFDACKKLKPLKLIQFRKNFGKSAALEAGIQAAKKDHIVTLDADGQNDPADIPQMIDYLIKNDLDVVSGYRKNRQDPAMKIFVSRVANFLRHIILHDDINDSGCCLKVYKKECFNDVTLCGGQHRFIPYILKTKGYKVGEIEVNHRPRINGKSKYNYKRICRGFMDMLSIWFWSKHSTRPMYLIGGTGIVLVVLGLICGVYTVALCIRGVATSSLIMLVSMMFVLTGIVLFALGLTNEAIIKTYYESKIEKPYNIKRIIENKK